MSLECQMQIGYALLESLKRGGCFEFGFFYSLFFLIATKNIHKLETYWNLSNSYFTYLLLRMQT